MCGKWRFVGSALVLALVVAVMPLQAQRGQGQGGPRAFGPGGPNMGSSVALALENQEELGLSGEQVAQLQNLKEAFDGDVAGLGESMKALRENIRAGEVERDEGFRQMEALRGELISASAPLRGRVQEILTVEQHVKLQALVRQDRQGRGEMGAVQGRGASRAQGRGMGHRMDGGMGMARRMGRGMGMGMGMGMGIPRQVPGGRGGAGFRPSPLGNGGGLS